MMSQETQSHIIASAPEIIRKKRDGEILSSEEITWFIQGLIKGEVPDYQMTALLMAIFKEGMTTAETAALTDAMLYSGAVLNFNDIFTVDKHSTGGVGDKASFIIGPLAAAAGVHVPMMAGRGLGHTGGTIDKIESIPGYRTDLPLEKFKTMVCDHRFSLIGQTAEIAPADKIIYGLRDVTATVESIPLITASIMSKKLAEGANAIVMDVKTGAGAFMKKRSDAKALAKSLIQTAKRFDRSMYCFITDMNQPLGNAIGNSLEIKESIETLKGRGPADLTELSLQLTAGMIQLAGLSKTQKLAYKKAREVLDSGAGLEEFRKLIARHGGDPNVIDKPSLLPEAPCKTPVKSLKGGYIKGLNTLEFGLLNLALGGGRIKAGQQLDLAVGVVLHKKHGEKVKVGESLCTIHHHPHQKELVENFIHKLQNDWIKISTTVPKKLPLIYEILS